MFFPKEREENNNEYLLTRSLLIIIDKSYYFSYARLHIECAEHISLYNLYNNLRGNGYHDLHFTAYRKEAQRGLVACLITKLVS